MAAESSAMGQDAGRDLKLLFTVRSHLRYTDLFEALCRAVFPEFGIEEDRADWVCLSVREAVNNAILHGNRQDPERVVEFEMARSGSVVTIRVWDQGGGFDQGGLSDPTRPENLLRPNGRGIFLIRQFVDKVRFLTDRPGWFGMEMLIDINRGADAPKGEE
jgi:serine/threonine-protein kinase RsbW